MTATIPSHQHYLVEEAAGTGGTTDLPTPDDSGAIAMAATAGTVALVHDTAALACTGATCTRTASVIDLVGYGIAANTFEGAGPAPAPSATTSDERDASATDTDNNAADFTAGTPDPQNSGNAGGGQGQPGPLAIHDIQGDSWVSTQDGKAVTDVPGIVTTVRTGSSKSSRRRAATTSCRSRPTTSRTSRRAIRPRSTRRWPRASCATWPSPDVVALEEIQDNSGATDNGVVAADRTLDQLTAAIAADGGPQYEWREIDPVNDRDGGRPGGNIRNAFLFNPARVSFVDRGTDGVDRSTTGTQVVGKNRKVSLSLSPGRIDPTNPVWTDSRKPLAGQFRFRGQDVFVIANHFDSKGGDENADGRYQYPAQQSRVQRAGQAQAVHDFVARLLAADPKAEVAVVGDLNDYQSSPPLAALETGTSDGSGPAILTDLITTLPIDQRYTYVYNGISQVLDHILVSPSVGHVDYQVVHVNAEYHDQISDHDPQVVDFTP